MKLVQIFTFAGMTSTCRVAALPHRSITPGKWWGRTPPYVFFVRWNCIKKNKAVEVSETSEEKNNNKYLCALCVLCEDMKKGHPLV